MLKDIFKKYRKQDIEGKIEVLEEIVEKVNIDSTENGYKFTSNLYKKNSRFRDTGFFGTALLSDQTFDFKELREDLSNIWFIEMGDHVNLMGTYVFNVGNFIANISLIKKPVPLPEIQTAAAKNYTWLEGINQSSEHKGQLSVSVIGEGSPYEKSKVFVKILETCCNQANVIGVYTNGAVYSPVGYKDLADIMDVDNSALPILNLVWIGINRSENGVNLYTNGLKAFYKDEIEIIDSTENPSFLHGVMIDLVNYVLENNTSLENGETISFKLGQKLSITRSEGVSCDGTTLKIKIN